VACVVMPACPAEIAIGLLTEPSSIDPHFAILGANQALSAQIFGRLVGRDRLLRPKPALALSWRLIDETHWEFKLRPGTVFHDGTPFTAEDAVFTIARAPSVPNSPASYAPYVSHIAEAGRRRRSHASDSHHWSLPDAAARSFRGLCRLQTRSRACRDRGFQFRQGGDRYGTLPFRRMTEGAAHPSGAQRTLLGPAARVRQRPPPHPAQDSARVAALLAGEVSLIEGVPPGDLAPLRKDPAVAVWSAPSTRLIYLHMDTAREATPFAADKAGQPLARNPLLDPRIRLALSRAINRQDIIDHILEGSASVAGQDGAAGPRRLERQASARSPSIPRERGASSPRRDIPTASA